MFSAIPGGYINAKTSTVMTRDKTVFLDTNILLIATDESKEYHSSARDIVSKKIDYIFGNSGQVLREYLVVATRPTEANGLSMKPFAAIIQAHGTEDYSVFTDVTVDSTRNFFDSLL